MRDKKKSGREIMSGPTNGIGLEKGPSDQLGSPPLSASGIMTYVNPLTNSLRFIPKYATAMNKRKIDEIPN